MLVEVVARLRVLGSDLTDVEVKSAAGGMPESINATLSAFANTPGGGLVVLGLQESSGFRPVGLADPAGLAANLATRGRSFQPPVRFEELGPVEFEGAEVVVARVAECPASAKPCRAPDGRAYLRAFDGDYPLSAVEEQGFLASRGTPTFDRKPVVGATEDDLDGVTLSAWATRIGASGSSLGRFTGDELLRRAGVIEPSGTPTVAGLLAFGKFPQQWFPRFIINAGVQAPAAGDGLVRLADHEVIDGPIPVMLDRAMAWAERTFTRALRQDPATGMVTDRRQFPMIAFREIMSNALVHRDLADWSTGQAIEVRITDRGALVVTNPGGLYGITADRLGAEHVTSARNPVLVRLAETLTTPTGGRVIEGLATGIPAIQASLAEAGMPPARFSDSAIRFTVLLEPDQPATPVRSVAAADSPSTKAVLQALATGEHPIDWITEQTGLSPANARRILRRLRQQGRIIQNGGPGQPTTYRRPG